MRPRKPLNELTTLKNGQHLLLHLLWQKYGGPFAVAKKIGVARHAPGNWSRDGAVPLKYIKLVADGLDVPSTGLNWKAAKGFFDGKWKNAVELYDFTSQQKRQILRLGEP